MSKELFMQAIGKFIMGVIVLGMLLFIPAGSLKYMNAWLLLIILFIPMFVAGLILMAKNPELLKKRLSAKEKETEQQWVIKLSGIMFLFAFVLAGLNYRFNLIPMTKGWVIMGIIMFLCSYALYAEVLRENTYLSRTIEVQKGQHVVSTGLYGIVRHPMYAATLFLFISMGFVLASWLSVIVLLLYIPIIQKRMNNEEEVLEEGLIGYKDYMHQVTYRVIPYIW